MKCLYCNNSSNFKKGYIGFKFIKVKICANCGEALFNGGVIAEMIFQYILLPFWDGHIVLEGDSK